MGDLGGKPESRGRSRKSDLVFLGDTTELHLDFIMMGFFKFTSPADEPESVGCPPVS